MGDKTDGNPKHREEGIETAAGFPNNDGVTRRHLVKHHDGHRRGYHGRGSRGQERDRAFAQQVSDALGSVLPFQPVPTASTAGPDPAGIRSMSGAPSRTTFRPTRRTSSLSCSTTSALACRHARRRGPYADVDAPGQTRASPSTSSTPTSICSPTRAALLTGRNHQRVGSGTIAERALDFDGYTGVIPKTAATVAQVLRDYGYKTSAFGKWHNTPATETTAMGPFDRWPTGYGFDYFYGFMAGETSQYEPRLFENTLPIEPPRDPTYHLSSDMADKALAWLRKHRAFAPDKPFLMYWAPGAAHGPHHVFKEWADKYKGKFDDRLGRLSRACFQAAKGNRLDSRRYEADAARRDDGVVGQHPGVAAALPDPVDGGLRRLRRACRRAGRAARRRPRGDENPRQHDHLLCLRRQRLERRGPERHDQRTSRAEHDPQHDRAATRRARQDRRPRRAGNPQDRQHVSRGLGVGRRHAVPTIRSWSPRISAARAIRWSFRGRRGSSPTRRRDRSFTMSTTSRRRSTISSASSRRKSSTDGSSCRSTASA